MNSEAGNKEARAQAKKSAEFCAECNQEVEIDLDFSRWQKCPYCGAKLLPCAGCCPVFRDLIGCRDCPFPLEDVNRD